MPGREAAGGDLYWGKSNQQRPVLINVTASWVRALPAQPCRAPHSHGIDATLAYMPTTFFKKASFQ